MVAILFVLISIVNGQLDCATETSYCLTGLKITDFNDLICSQYIYEGTLNDCSYFKSIDDIYLFWNSQNSRWHIWTDYTSNSKAAYCNEPILDNCGRQKWVYYDGNSEYMNPDLQLIPCNYDNADCLAQFTANDTYCVGNTLHRDINTAIRGKYEFNGCFMNQPYFVHPVNFTDGEIVNYTISWDDILSSWHISGRIASSSDFDYAYCMQSDITKCSNNWYIYDGENTLLDDKVVSGYCNICIDEPIYEQVCMIGGISINSIIGQYQYTECDELYPHFVQSSGKHFSVSYNIWLDEYLILDEDNLVDARCNGSDIVQCIEYTDQWYIWNGSSGAFELNDGFQTSECSEVNDHCNVNYEYCLKVYDDAYTEYEGIYRYNGCDENNYPAFHQYQDMDGHLANYSMIQFDFANSYFDIKSRDMESPTIYAFCNSLLLDSCQGFWLPSSRNFTLYRCNETAKSEETFWTQYWYIFVICAGVLIVVFAIFVCCKVRHKRKTDPERAALMNANDEEELMTVEDGNGGNGRYRLNSQGERIYD